MRRREFLAGARQRGGRGRSRRAHSSRERFPAGLPRRRIADDPTSQNLLNGFMQAARTPVCCAATRPPLGGTRSVRSPFPVTKPQQATPRTRPEIAHAAVRGYWSCFACIASASFARE